MIEVFAPVISVLPPGFLLIFAGLMVPLLSRGPARILMLTMPILGLIQVAMMPEGHHLTVTLFDGDAGAALGLSAFRLDLVHVDRLSRLFGIVFHIAAFVSVIYALHVRHRVQHVAGLTYAGSAIAAVFAGDLISLFLFWELTAITSLFLIWGRCTEPEPDDAGDDPAVRHAHRNYPVEVQRDRSYRTGLRYLTIQVVSGVLLLAGAVIWAREPGAMVDGVLEFRAMELEGIGTWLIFLAFGIKAAFPLLHAWLEDAYPEATVTGTVWLSAFTTKLAIYALARGFAGTEILIPIGAAMTAFPIFFAVIENDLRRVLAYSLNNQLGYMVVGIGIGTELALNGTAAHAFAHIVYKGLLFMSMGAVLYRTGTVNGSQLGGLYKSMPFTTVFCIIGACAISAFPLFSGFISKSMILTAAAEEHHTITFLVLLFASAGVFHHSGIKIPFFAFFAHDSGIRVKEAPRNMLVAMAIAAFLCVGVGIWYEPLYAILPYDVDYSPYNTSHVVTQLQLLLYSAAAFVFLQKTGLYPPELPSVNLDIDWTWRKAAPAAIAACMRVGGGIWTAIIDTLMGVVRGLLEEIRRMSTPPGIFGEPWPTGTAALWAAVLLTLTLVLSYI